MFKKKEIEKEAEPKAKPAADAIIKGLADGIMIVGLDGEIVNVNPACAKMLGYDTKELIGKNVAELPMYTKPEDIEKAMALMKEIIEKGSAKPIEMMSGTKDGREFPCSFTASLIKDAEGNPQNLVAVIRDITELKRAEEERIKAEKEVAALKRAADTIEAMPIGVVITDLEGKIIQENKESHRIFGYGPTPGEPVTDFLVEEEVPRVLKAFQECMEKGYYRGFETTGVAKDGRKISLLVDATLLRDTEGNPSSIVITYRDVTELKRAEEERIKAEKEVAALKRAADTIEAMPIGSAVLDMEGKILDVNEVSAKMFGYSKDEAIETPVTSYMVKEDVPRALEAIKGCIAKGFYRGFETTGIRKDGSKFPLIVDGTLIKDLEGNPTSIVMAFRDITELKKTITDLEKTKVELEKKIRDLERFQKVTMDREKRVLELKKEIKELKKKLESEKEWKKEK